MGRRHDRHPLPRHIRGRGYNRLVTEIAGRQVENEDLVNMPNWLSLTWRIGDGLGST